MLSISIVNSCQAPRRKCIDLSLYRYEDCKKLKINAKLSDTVFSSEEVLLYSDSIYDRISQDPSVRHEILTEFFRGPRLTFSIVNESKCDFILPHYAYESVEGPPLPFGASIDWSGDSLKQCVDIRIWDLPDYCNCETGFSELASGDSIVILDTIDVFYRYRAESPAAGEYEVRVHFWNYLWYDTIPEVWIGETWSDTLRFKVVDDL